MRPQLLSASSMIGDPVISSSEDKLGDVKELMIDVVTGRIAYAVLAFGGVLGMGEKLFAIPWDTIRLDAANKRFVLDVDKQVLENAPGFDKNNWPDMADQQWQSEVHRHFNVKPYWESAAYYQS